MSHTLIMYLVVCQHAILHKEFRLTTLTVVLSSSYSGPSSHASQQPNTLQAPSYLLSFIAHFADEYCFGMRERAANHSFAIVAVSACRAGHDYVQDASIWLMCIVVGLRKSGDSSTIEPQYSPPRIPQTHLTTSIPTSPVPSSTPTTARTTPRNIEHRTTP